MVMVKYKKTKKKSILIPQRSQQCCAFYNKQYSENVTSFQDMNQSAASAAASGGINDSLTMLRYQMKKSMAAHWNDKTTRDSN